jgi:nitrogenase molybdenum-cofactor synthesis protein NifE
MTPIILKEREKQIELKGSDTPLSCEKHSVAGMVSQRACVFCGSRVVLYPVGDALHLIHGPIGCAAYTWDIRGALSSGRQLHRMSFCTDLREQDVVFGGEKKLYKSLCELIEEYKPAAAFVYTTCIVGIIGDDVEAVCRKVSAQYNIEVITVNVPGFGGTKKDGYRVACEALEKLVGTGDTSGISKQSINILGDFNIAGETWIVKKYYERMGVEVVATITGDATVEAIRRAHGATLNVVQCSGSMLSLAKTMQQHYGIPFIRVSYFGIEDCARALYDVANHFGDTGMVERTRELVREEMASIMPAIMDYAQKLNGKRAAIYTGGAFKAFSLIRALRMVGMSTVLVGTQTGNKDDYELLRQICDPGTVIVDDASTLELARFCVDKKVDLFIGGVKERPIAYKMGIGFCDHNHERKIALAGFVGMLNFIEEVYRSTVSPVWSFTPRFAHAIDLEDNHE